MVKLPSSELTGAALTWAGIKASGFMPVINKDGICYKSDHGSWVYPNFESPQESAEIAEREWIGLMRPSKGQKTPQWQAITDSKMKQQASRNDYGVVSAWAPTSHLATARVFVISKLGAEIEVPKELVEAVAQVNVPEFSKKLHGQMTEVLAPHGIFLSPCDDKINPVMWEWSDKGSNYSKSGFPTLESAYRAAREDATIVYGIKLPELDDDGHLIEIKEVMTDVVRP